MDLARFPALAGEGVLPRAPFAPTVHLTRCGPGCSAPCALQAAFSQNTMHLTAPALGLPARVAAQAALGIEPVSRLCGAWRQGAVVPSGVQTVSSVCVNPSMFRQVAIWG